MAVRLPKLLQDRTRRLNRRRVKSNGSYVMCWLQQALRSHDNPILDAAITIGNQLDLPVVVYHGLDNRYPHASHRIHRFILEASQSLESGLRQRRLRFCRYVRRPDKRLPGLVYQMADAAACIVTDDMPTFVAKRQAESVAQRMKIPVFAVDAACLVPMNLLPDRLEATKAFRAAHRPLRVDYIDGPVDIQPTVRKFTKKLCFEHDAIGDYSTRRLDTFIGGCGVDMSLPPAKNFSGDRATALERLTDSVNKIVPRYKWTRNNPSLDDSTTKLSPYLHFGVLGPREVALQVNEADIHSAARWKFLDELLTWREYYHHLARHSDQPDAYAQVPHWGRKTLADHAGDERPAIYTLSQLLHAETNDEVWNAAQRQFTLDGWMHNNLRMYWVKQIIKWTETPEEAWDAACYLNDRLSLDGRDPSTYGGIQWGFGRSKRGYRETAIYGWVPPKSATTLRKRAGVTEWIAKMNERTMIRVDMKKSDPR